MSKRTILPLVFLSMLFFVLLTESSNAQNQAKEKKQKEAADPAVKDAVPRLIRALKDKDPLVRLRAAGALGIGPVAKDAVPALIEALKDKDGNVRLLALSALGKIGPAAVPALSSCLLCAQHEAWAGCGCLGQSLLLTVPGGVSGQAERLPYAIWGLSISRMMRSRRERCSASGGGRLSPAAFT